jgi:HEAT repeat protein
MPGRETQKHETGCAFRVFAFRVFVLLFFFLSNPLAGQGAGDDPVTVDLQVLKKAGISTDSAGLLDFFRRRTLSDLDRGRIEGLIRDLGSPDYSVRQRASAQLVAEGTRAKPLLRRAATHPDLEIRRRAEDCLKGIGNQDVGPNVVSAAARLIGARRPPGAAEVLLNFLPFAESEGSVDDIQRALTSLAIRDGKPDPVVATALRDKDPLRRTAAAVALCQPAATELRPAILQLMHDPDLNVRLGVAVALAAAKEKDAIGALIEMLSDLSPSQGWRAEECLCRLAGDQAPSVSLGLDPASRRKCRDAWADWWREHGATIDLARMDQPPPMLGFTLVILLDQNSVLELDRANHVRWQVDGLRYPLDAEMLPGNRVLIAEHDGNRVTERNTKGEILWKYEIEEPIMAQRLANGNTFIASQDHLVEVDRAGRQVFSLVQNSSVIMKARKLPNGDIVYVSFTHRVVRLNSAGHEISSFPAFVSIWGGRLDVLPNGNILVPEHDRNRVAEYDAHGNVVWEARLSEPIAAVRLPNGHTLVTFMSKHQGVEVDEAGKVVWDYPAKTRVTRLFRR